MIPYTKLKDHQRRNLREVIPLEKPFTLVVEPTSLCNFKCLQCFQSVSGEGYFARSKTFMKMECFDRVIGQMKAWKGPRLKVLKLSLYGEPLLHPRFCEMLQIAKAADVAERIESTTNASLLTPETSARLVELGLDYLRVSIYSALQEKHARLTQSRTTLEAIRGNLEALKRAKEAQRSDRPFVGVKMLDAYGEENELFRGMFADVADEVYLDKPHNWIAVREKDFIDELYGVEAEKARKDLESGSSRRIACTMPFFTLVVRSNGDVSPCCIDWTGGTNLGNVDGETLEEIWHGEAMFEFRKMHLEDRKDENESCRNCEVYLSDHYTRDNVDGFPVERLRQPRK